MNAIADILSSKRDDFLNEPQTVDNRVQTTVDVQTLKSVVQIDQLKSMLYSLRDQIDAAIRIINGEAIQQHAKINNSADSILDTGEQIIEGVFNGEKMVGPDGKEYSVPPNYASKSKMVEGDLLKLTITRNGQFIYKQTGPVERERRRGELVSDPVTDQWSVLSDGRTYTILKASVTFYKGQAGDEVIFLVPKDANGSAAWGAVENIIHT